METKHDRKRHAPTDDYDDDLRSRKQVQRTWPATAADAHTEANDVDYCYSMQTCKATVPMVGWTILPEKIGERGLVIESHKCYVLPVMFSATRADQTDNGVTSETKRIVFSSTTMSCSTASECRMKPLFSAYDAVVQIGETEMMGVPIRAKQASARYDKDGLFLVVKANDVPVLKYGPFRIRARRQKR